MPVISDKRTTVVIVNGAPRSGKDTAVLYMSERAEELGWNAHAMSTIDCVKALLADFPLEAKGSKERALLSEVGDAVERYNGFRTNSVMAKLDVLEGRSFKPIVLFVHLREPALISKLCDLIKSRYDLTRETRCTTLVVRNPVAEMAATSNDSDANVLKFDYQWMVANNGTLGQLLDNARATIDRILAS